MPEIAEVRTVARTLNRSLVGRKIASVQTPYSKIIMGDVEEFKKNVISREIKGVANYGKWLLFDLGDITLLSHLRMEGKYFIKNRQEKYEPHEHIIFELDNGLDLRYHDTRKFGRMFITATKDVMKCPEIAKLGPEPDSESLTATYLYEQIHKKRLPIKTLLLDQTIVNGLGNIYVDEVLFKAGINPLKPGSLLETSECQKIKEACQEIIPKATQMGGTTIRSYTSSNGSLSK